MNNLSIFECTLLGKKKRRKKKKAFTKQLEIFLQKPPRSKEASIITAGLRCVLLETCYRPFIRESMIAVY